MIKILKKDGLNAPIISCDICTKIIDDTQPGAAVFNRPVNEGDVVDVIHAHKGKCHDLADQKLGGGKAP